MELSKLKSNYYINNPNGHYFDADMMSLHGERESRMYVLKKKRDVIDIVGRTITCWVLSKETRTPAGEKTRTYDYFSVRTGSIVYPAAVQA